jgi:hypothetical protein
MEVKRRPLSFHSIDRIDNMTNPVIMAIAGVFYLLLLAGALARVFKSRSAHNMLQLLGTVLPIIPSLVILKYGFSNFLICAYGFLWLPMGVGYLLEGFEKPRENARQKEDVEL